MDSSGQSPMSPACPAMIQPLPGRSDVRPARITREPPRLRPAEPPSDPDHQAIKVRVPPRRVHGVARGNRKIIRVPHEPA